MSNKELKTRIQLKNDTAINWDTASKNGFVPKKGEPIFYREEGENGKIYGMKVGDDLRAPNELDFIGGASENNLPFYVDEGSYTPIVRMNNHLFSFEFGEEQEPLFTSRLGYFEYGGPMQEESLYVSDFEIGKTYYFIGNDSLVPGEITYNGTNFTYTPENALWNGLEEGTLGDGFAVCWEKVRVYENSPPTPVLSFNYLNGLLTYEPLLDTVGKVITGPFLQALYEEKMLTPAVGLSIEGNQLTLSSPLIEGYDSTVTLPSGADGNTEYSLTIEENTLKLTGTDGSVDEVVLPTSGGEGPTYQAATDSLIEINGALIGTKYLKQGAVANSIKAFDGNAKGNFSLAMGTADKEALQNIIGFKDGLAYDVKIVEEAPSTLSAGSIATGIMTTAGIKGYYYNNVTSNTIKLVTTQNGSTAVTDCTWQAGDVLTIVNDNQYTACATIKSIDKSTGIITIEGTFPFTEKASVDYPKPDDFTVFACYKKDAAQVTLPVFGTVLYSESRYYPRDGAVELGWAGTTLGALNAATGTGSFVFGYNNWQAGNFGMTGGRGNIGGYCGITAGLNNKNYGWSSLALGRDLINNGDYNALSGRENTINNVPGADHSSYNSISGVSNIVSGHRNIVGGGANKAETTYYGSIFGGGNILNGTNYVSVFGRGNGSTTPITGNYHFVAGTKNTVSGTMNTVFGGSYDYGETGGHTVSGIGNIVGGFNNIASKNFGLVHGANNNLGHVYSYLLGRELTSTNDYQLIIGSHNDIVENAALIIGSGGVNGGAAKNALVVTKSGQLTTTGITASTITASSKITASTIVSSDKITATDEIRSKTSIYSEGKIVGLKNIISGGSSNKSDISNYNLLVGVSNVINAKSAENTGNTVTGLENTIGTTSTTVYGTLVGGRGLTANYSYQAVVGKYNNAVDAAFVVGNGSSSAKSNAFVVQRDGRATVGKAPVNAMDVATKSYVDSHAGGVDEEQVRTIIEDVLLNGEW